MGQLTENKLKMEILKGLLLVIFLSLVLYAGEEWGILPILPWWKVAFVTLIVGLWMPIKAWKSFLYGFLAIAVWWGYFAFFANQANGGVLSMRIGQLFNGLSPVFLLLITALVVGYFW